MSFDSRREVAVAFGKCEMSFAGRLACRSSSGFDLIAYSACEIRSVVDH
jgi:hypothetical protein